MKDKYHLTLTVDEDYYSHRVKKEQTIEISIDGYIFQNIEVERLLAVLKSEMTLAHNTQTKLVQDEIRGDEIKISLLLIHAQDQLMTAMAEQTLILQMIDMQKEIDLLKK